MDISIDIYGCDKHQQFDSILSSETHLLVRFHSSVKILQDLKKYEPFAQQVAKQFWMPQAKPTHFIKIRSGLFLPNRIKL